MIKPAVLSVLFALVPGCGDETGETAPCADDTRCLAEHRVCLVADGIAVCGDCLPGFHREGQACAADQVCQPDSCSGHGGCDGSTGRVVCTCDPGYAGGSCGNCAPGYSRDPASGLCLEDASCCDIGGTCLPVNSLDPLHACAVCDPARDPAGWSPALAGTECRSSAGACDQAETCDGASFDCPEDPLAYLGGDWAVILTATRDALYCHTYREWDDPQRTGLEESLAAKAQLRVLPGEYRLPETNGTYPYRLPVCVTFQDPLATPALDGVGQVTGNHDANGRRYQITEPMSAPNGDGWALEVGIYAAADAQAVVLDGADTASFGGDSASLILCRNGCGAGLEFRVLESCTFPNHVLQDTHRLEFQGGRLELVMRFGDSALFPGPAVFYRAAGELDGTAFEQLDYWKLVYSAPHHHFIRHFVVLFDQPIGQACGLRVENLDPYDGSAPSVSLAGCDLAPLSSRAVTGYQTIHDWR